MTRARRARDGALAVAEYGRGGIPLLLLHGIGGGKASWEPVARILSARRRVVTPDLLGFGESPWPDAGYMVGDHVAALERTMDEWGLSDAPLDIGGHSMGAILAAELAARRGPRVGRVTLVSLPYFRSDDEARASIARLGLLARLTVVGHWAAGAVCGAMCALRPALKLAAPHFASHLPAAVASEALMHNYRSYSRTLRNVVVRHRADGALAALAGRRVLLVHGEDDRSAPLRNVEWLVSRYPAWRLDVVARANHLLPLEQPERLARMLENGWR